MNDWPDWLFSTGTVVVLGFLLRVGWITYQDRKRRRDLRRDLDG